MASPEPTRVGIAGVTGYTGLELARLLAGHPGLSVVAASSDAMAGQRLSALDPDLAGASDAAVVGHGDAVSAAVDMGAELMFLAMPAEVTPDVATRCLEAGLRVVDLSGAHRLKDPVAHLMAYGFEHEDPQVSLEAVYGLTEHVPPEALAAARLVANPGCYPTAVLLALLPLVEAGLVEPGSLVVDAKSGTTGAGRSAKVSLLHAEIDGDFYAYRVGRHQHTPEISQALALVGGRPVDLTFVTHLLPVARGILATCYLRVPDVDSAEQAARKVDAALRARYADAPFVRVLDKAEDVRLRAVTGTNRCVMAAVPDAFGRRVVVVSAIDNLVKGAAGQAIQNANLMLGFEQTAGLGLGTGGRP